jgi:predicted RNA-binding Zn-ribbon protein involved in translation (DUF1610 family)
MRSVALHTNMSPSSVPRPQPRSKATLFCPDCGHESHVGGDWRVETAGGRTTTACPECGARIDDRRHEERPNPGTSLAASAAVRRTVGTSLAVQRRLFEWWTRHGRRMFPTTG